MNYIAEIKCKDGETYVGLMRRKHCSTNCSMHDFEKQPVEYIFPITKNYTKYFNLCLSCPTGHGIENLQGVNVKESIAYLKNAIVNLHCHEEYNGFSDEEEADYYNPTPKNAIKALTHLMEMAEECVDTTCTWNIKEG